MNPAARYYRELIDRFGSGWNHFWFSPVDPIGVCVLRLFVGVLALWFVLSYSWDLVTWFGMDGLLPIETVQQLTADPEQHWNARVTYLNFVDEPALLWAVHILGMVVVAAFMLGFASRVTSVLSLIVVLSYIHRAPMITGQFEPVLTLLLCYLCFAPCGRRLSLDSWLRRRRSVNLTHNDPTQPTDRKSWGAGLCVRLMQVHIATLYLMMALNKLGGSDTWWTGEAIWWLIAQTESRLLNLSSLYNWNYTLNLWTHAVVGFELLFGVLIWHRLARPLLLGIAVVHWVLIGAVTGLLSFAAVMLVANLAFVSPATWRGGVSSER